MLRLQLPSGEYVILSIVSFIFLIISSTGLSLTLHDSYNITFIKNNHEVLIPFLSVVCGVFGLLFIYSFLDICISKCCCCFCVEVNSSKKILLDNISYDDNLYNNTIDTSINVNENKKETETETDPLLRPYPSSKNIDIPRKIRI